jgi:hypothetical protein
LSRRGRIPNDDGSIFHSSDDQLTVGGEGEKSTCASESLPDPARVRIDEANRARFLARHLFAIGREEQATTEVVPFLYDLSDQFARARFPEPKETPAACGN